MKISMPHVLATSLLVAVGCASEGGGGDPSNDPKNDTASDPAAQLVGAWERDGNEGPYLRMVFMTTEPRSATLRHDGRFLRYIADRDPTTLPFKGQPIEYFCTGKDCAPQREDAGYIASGSNVSLGWDLISPSCSGCITGDELQFRITSDQLTLMFEGKDVARLVRVAHTCSAPNDCSAQIIECSNNNNCDERELMDSASTPEKRWTCNAQHRCEFTSGKLCTAHGDCAADEYCQQIADFDVCGEQSGGSCVPRPTTCPTEQELDRRGCACESDGFGPPMSECEIAAAGDNPSGCRGGGD